MAAPNIPGVVPDPVGNAVARVQPIQPKGPSKAETDEDYFLNEYKGCTLKYDDKKDKYEPMLYDYLKIVDIDKSGEITAGEMDEMADIIVISKKAKANNSSELNYKHLPKAVSDVVSVWDTDKSGSVGVAELMAAAEAQKKMEKENTLVKKLLIGAMIVMAILMGGTFVLSLTAAEMAKEMKPEPDGLIITPSGKPADRFTLLRLVVETGGPDWLAAGAVGAFGRPRRGQLRPVCGQGRGRCGLWSGSLWSLWSLWSSLSGHSGEPTCSLPTCSPSSDG